MRRSAQQMVRDVLGAFGNEAIPLPTPASETALAIAQLQVEATCAVAQATLELQGELEGIRQAVLSLR